MLQLKNLKNSKVNIQGEIENALSLGFISKSESATLSKMAIYDPSEVIKILEESKKESFDSVDTEIRKAVLSGKFIPYEENVYKLIGKKLGVKVLP